MRPELLKPDFSGALAQERSRSTTAQSRASPTGDPPPRCGYKVSVGSRSCRCAEMSSVRGHMPWFRYD